jgi:hypothetical protein
MNRIATYLLAFVFGQINLLCAQTFLDVASVQGIDINNVTIDKWGTAVSFYDYNQDGWDDLSFALEGDTQAIYMNVQGNYILSSIKLFNSGETKMLLWVDYDNDGDLDLFFSAKNDKLSLLNNDGNFSFTDVTALAGLAMLTAINHGASWGDYDKDGFLDLYVCKYRGGGDATNLSHVNNLYHNNGNGTFTDVTFSSGANNGIAPSYQSVWIDYNNDSWQDILVINDRYGFPNALYHNNGDGTFQNVAAASGIAENQNNFMSGSPADFDNDGDLDVYMSNTATPPPGLFDFPYLFCNDGNGGFTNQADSFGLELNKTSWGGLWFDYDNNGLLDLYVATGNIDSSLAVACSYLYQSNYPNAFSIENSSFTGNHIATSFSVARGDIDNDGFYEIAVNNEAPNDPFLWKNSGNTNNYIKITLEGTVSNRFAIGSWIKVYNNGITQSQYTMCGENYLGQNSQHHIFGVGNDTLVDSVHVVYLSGVIDKYYSLPINQSYNFQEGETVNAFLIENVGPLVLCFGDTTTLQVPLFETYLWNTGDTTRQIEVWQAGNYSLTAIDSNGLINYSNVVEIDVLPDFIITANSQNMHCAELNDGEINLVVDNQGIPYTVEWNHGAIGDSLFNLNEGTYVFNYLDSFACQYTDSVQINAPFPINVQSLVSPQTPDTLGAISLNINGGFPPFQIFVDDVLSSTNINNLNAGFYSLEIIDENGCSWEQELEVIYLDSNANTGIFLHDDAIFQVYPLPFKDHITLSFFSKIIEPFDLNLFSEEGRLIVSQSFKTIFGLNELRMEIAQDIPAGLYMLELRSQSDSSSKILIKF